MLKYLSIQKIRLSILLSTSYLLSKWTGRNIRWGRYISLSIEPNNACNLSCPLCPTGLKNIKRAKGSLLFSDFQKVIDSKVKDLWYVNFYFQGEPFLNKDLPNMISLAHSKGIYTSVSTNAQLINEQTTKKIINSGLDRIIISIDGATQETYQAYRIGGTLQKLLGFTKALKDYKEQNNSRTPQIVFQFIVFRHNEHELDTIKKLAKEYGVDKLKIKTAQVYDFENDTNSIPLNDKYSRYRKNAEGIYQIKSKLSNDCWRMWHSAVVTESMDVVPCCFDKDTDYTLGNLRQESFSQIEQGKKYTQFRQSILRDRKQHAMCCNCTEGLRV